MNSGGLAVNVIASALVLLVLLLALWRLAVSLDDVSIIDIFWGPGFAVVGAVTLALGSGPFSRRLLLFGMTAAWGLRLGGYLWWRNHGKGEDARYTAMRRRLVSRSARLRRRSDSLAAPRVPADFNRYALVHVYLFQGVMLLIVSMPVQVGGYLTDRSVLAAPAWLGVALWVVGLLFESVGDLQLARFKANPASAGQVMDRGLWRYTRHPNYFGDACVWWGIWLVVCVQWTGALTVFSPALMTFLLVRVTGKQLLERRLGRSRPGYAEYVARTSGFIPRPPRRSVSV